MHQDQIQQFLDLATKLAIEAGHLAQTMQSNINIDYKQGNQIVTNADKACQEIILAGIQKAFPTHGFIGEESDSHKLLKISPENNCDIWWVVDPIDGTRNYAHGTGQYCVSIGVVASGVPICGAIYEPCSQKLFAGGTNIAPTCNKIEIKCNVDPFNFDSQIAIAGSHPIVYQKGIKQIIDNHVYINLGSAALHFAYLAFGAFQGAISWKLKLWDVVAGFAICQSAGCEIINFQNKKMVLFDLNNYHGESVPIISCTPRVKNGLLAALGV
jgi:myo-inositol-1(or 4)-monophosphatase